MFCHSGEEDQYGKRGILEPTRPRLMPVRRVGGHSWAVKRFFQVDVYRQEDKGA